MQPPLGQQLLLALRKPGGALQRLAQRDQGDGFGHKVKRPGMHRLLAYGHLVLPREHDGVQQGPARHQLGQQLKPFVGPAWARRQAQVQNGHTATPFGYGELLF